MFIEESMITIKTSNTGVISSYSLKIQIINDFHCYLCSNFETIFTVHLDSQRNEDS